MFISDLPRWMQANLALNSASVCIQKKMAADIVQEILTHAEKIITELEDTDLDAYEKQHVTMLNAAFKKLETDNHTLPSHNRGKNIIVAKKMDPTNPILNLAEGLGRITGSVASKLLDAGNKIGSLFFGGKKATKQQTFDMVVKILSLVHIDIDELARLTREVETEREDASKLQEKIEEEKDRMGRLIEDAELKAAELGGEETKQLQEHLETMKKDLENSNKATKGAEEIAQKLEADLEQVKDDLKRAQGELQLRDGRLKELERERGARMPVFTPADRTGDKDNQDEGGSDMSSTEDGDLDAILEKIQKKIAKLNGNAFDENKPYVGQLVNQNSRSHGEHYYIVKSVDLKSVDLKSLNPDQVKEIVVRADLDPAPYNKELDTDTTSYTIAKLRTNFDDLKILNLYQNALTKLVTDTPPSGRDSSISATPGPGIDGFATLKELRVAENSPTKYADLIKKINDSFEKVAYPTKVMKSDSPEKVGKIELKVLLKNDDTFPDIVPQNGTSKDAAQNYIKKWYKYVDGRTLSSFLKTDDPNYNNFTDDLTANTTKLRNLAYGLREKPESPLNLN